MPFVNIFFFSSCLRYIEDAARKTLLGYLGADAAVNITAEDEASSAKVDTPEVDVYLHLLVMIFLLDQGHLEKVSCFYCLIEYSKCFKPKPPVLMRPISCM